MPASRTAFVEGKVWTAGYGAPRELDVLVVDGHIAQVARSGELDTAGARLVGMRGRLLVPGFQDAHAHPTVAGANLLSCDLSGLLAEEQIFQRVAAYAAGLPEHAWVLGGGWEREAFVGSGPTRDQLDVVTGGRPSLLRSFDCHGAWANSAALRIAGVDRDTPDPEHGFFVRDTCGVPTGMLEERAVSLVMAHVPPETTESQQQALLRANGVLLGLGITSLQDAIVGGGLDIPDQIPAYRELVSRRAWQGRLTTALWWDGDRGLDQIPELQDKRRALEECADTAWIIADTVKIMVDGTNTVFIDSDALREATVALDTIGFTCHYHSYGELSTTWVLDAVADARAVNGPGGGRHHIAHLMVVGESDFARFAELDVSANVQAAWGYSTVAHDILGLTTCSDDPQLREYAFGRLAAAGARLVAGSDWPVTTADPLEAMRLEATRGRVRTSTGAEGDPDELDRLDVPTLFTAYTAGSAFVNGRARTTGRIAPGFLADLVVLDRDPFSSDESLHDVSVDETWIDGECVFREGET
jgi:predicted amidohydrolase YtcJ